MKSITRLLAFSFVALAALFAAPNAHAQFNPYKSATYFGGTANSPASTDNTTWYTTNSQSIFVGRDLEAAIQLDFKLTGAGTSSVIARFDESVDGISWTASTRLMTNTAAGTTLVSLTKTYTVGAVGYLRLASINNANATAVTNLTVKIAQKDRK